MAERWSAQQRQQATALRGRHVVVTRGGAEGIAFALELEALGATALFCPSIQTIAPAHPELLRHAVQELAQYHWMVFTSAHGVRAVAQELLQLRTGAHVPACRIAAVGPATAAAIVAEGWPVHCQAERGGALQLARELPIEHGVRVLLPRSDLADAALPKALADRGCDVDEVIAYRTIVYADPETCGFLLHRGAPVDALTFTSPSAVAGFLHAARKVRWDARKLQQAGRLVITCIGTTTASALPAYGLHATSIARDQSMPGLIDALVQALSASPPDGRPRPHHTGEFLDA